MPLSQQIPEIRPISDLRTHLAEIEEIAEMTGMPIVLTRNGLSKLVVMDSQAYNERIQHDRMVMKLREAEIEEKYRKDSLPYANVKQRMERILESAEARNA